MLILICKDGGHALPPLIPPYPKNLSSWIRISHTHSSPGLPLSVNQKFVGQEGLSHDEKIEMTSESQGMLFMVGDMYNLGKG